MAYTAIEDFDRVLEAARVGDEDAAAVLFSALHPPLLRYLRWREPSAADDLAAETWLALAEALDRFEGGEQDLRAWLFSVARRRLADYRRRGARRRTDPVSTDVLAESVVADDHAEHTVGSLSAQQALRTLVADLSPDQAEILVLRVLGGFSVEEVAAILGMRPGTVRMAQHRALKRLARAPGVVAALGGEG